jgi:hypothetical protein
MRKLSFALLCVCVGGLVTASVAAAFVGGGRKPSEAPTVAWGQHYTGQLNNRESDANYGGRAEVALWRLPPVSTRDMVVVNWHTLPYAGDSQFPVCMALIQGVDDFSWGGVFEPLFGYETWGCSESGPAYRVSGSGSAQTQITVQNTDPSSTYLAFFAVSREDTPIQFETYPYDFNVEAPRSYLGLALKPKSNVRANGAIVGSATLATGLPAPDGLPFSMTVTWPDGGVAAYTALSSGGSVVFPLALPESAVGKQAQFVVAHGADASFQAVQAELSATVRPVKASVADLACRSAVNKARGTSRQLKRLQRNAKRARGETRRQLKRKVRKVKRKLKGARAGVRASCPR